MQWYRIGSYGRKYIADSGFLIKTAAAWEIRSGCLAVVATGKSACKKSTAFSRGIQGKNVEAMKMPLQRRKRVV